MVPAAVPVHAAAEVEQPCAKNRSIQASSDLKADAKLLLRRLLPDGIPIDQVGGFTPAVYDTAWLALIKSSDEQPGSSWMFPNAFSYIIEQQSKDGAWTVNSGHLVDEILNSLAGLLCLSVHCAHPDSALHDGALDLQGRIQRANEAIQSRLDRWDVSRTDSVGFEIIVPSHLDLLREMGHDFQFPARHELTLLRERKLAKFTPKLLYSPMETTFLHSLEGVIGLVDFDRLGHHVHEEYGMLGSPASTAAYVLSISKRDFRAERYLQHVYDRAGPSGGVPSAFPTPNFEISWVLSTLLASDFGIESLDSRELRRASTFLDDILAKQGGVSGFAPGILPDADDTAKLYQLSSLLGDPRDPEPLVREFWTEKCFKTYSYETNASFSANCNALIAALTSGSSAKYSDKVAKGVSFLCDQWRQGSIKDKWNLTPLYPSMLLLQTLYYTLAQRQLGQLISLHDVFDIELPLIVSQIVSQVSCCQGANGSWNDSVEQTAYAVLTLAWAMKLPLARAARAHLSDTIAAGRGYLTSRKQSWQDAEPLWVEKVSYGSSILSETYCLAAMNISTAQQQWSRELSGIFAVPAQSDMKMRKLVIPLPLLREVSEKSIAMALFESHCFHRRLVKQMPQVFDLAPSADLYLPFVPFTWIVCNQLSGYKLSSNEVWEMIVVSVLVYQTDQYMESVVGSLSSPAMELLEAMIRDYCGCSQTSIRSSPTRERSGLISANKGSYPPKQSQIISLHNPGKSAVPSPLSPPILRQRSDSVELLEIGSTMHKLIKSVLLHPCVLDSNEFAQKQVATELCGFLLAHILHIQDNACFISETKQKQDRAEVMPQSHHSSRDNGVRMNDSSSGDPQARKTFDSANTSYFDWVSTVASDDTSCPFAYTFFCCLVSSPMTRSKGRSQRKVTSASSSGTINHPLGNARDMYLSQSLCRQLARMCRQYNDYGSFARDLAEGNLNSLNFREFQCLPSRSDVMVDIGKLGYPVINEPERQQQQRQKGSTEQALAMLIDIAEYERSCVEMTLSRLRSSCDEELADALRVFVDVTDIYGQIYVLRDLTNRVK